MNSLDMRIKAWYGDEKVSLPIPDSWRVETSVPPLARKLTRAEIESALDHPIGTDRLQSLGKNAKSAAIIVEDMTRPTPTTEIIPSLLTMLCGIGLDQDSIRFVMALGGHRQMPRDEMVKKLGADVVGHYEVLNHDMTGEFSHYGASSRGTPIYVSKAVGDADLKIILGTAYPRPGTGFGGGAKCLVPGVAKLETLAGYHSLSGKGALDPTGEMRQDIEEIARTVGINYIVNAVLNGDREIAGLFAGDVVDAHRAAGDFCKQINLMPMIEDADVVVSNCYPFDTNMRYTWRGTWPFGSSPDALHILVDYSPEGSGYHQHFKAGGLPFAVRSDRDASYHLFSPMIGPKEVNEVTPHAQHHATWDSIVELVAAKAGDSPKVAFYPQAGMCWHT
ncbi:MAG: lactate racemase domain-containing protein [Candidatus Poribacteria bacterium]|nr:lactate racemase domain-containing protein [Candidatus Poribacteria bacterium]